MRIYHWKNQSNRYESILISQVYNIIQASYYNLKNKIITINFTIHIYHVTYCHKNRDKNFFRGLTSLKAKKKRGENQGLRKMETRARKSNLQLLDVVSNYF